MRVLRFAAALAAFSLASSAADFTFRNHGDPVTLRTADAPVTVVVFISGICPISNAYIDRLNELYKTWSARGVKFAFANPNVNESVASVQEHATANKLAFPVYVDFRGSVAATLKAQMTPEVFVFDQAGNQRYHGRVDDAVNPARVRSHDLQDALSALLSGKLEAGLKETRAFGCTIKRRGT